MIGRNKCVLLAVLALSVFALKLGAQQSVTASGTGGGDFGSGAAPASQAIPIVVTGLAGSVNVSTVSITISVRHAWCGDVNLTLTDPQSNVHPIFTKIGGGTFGDSSDFGVSPAGAHGVYTFNDTAAGNIWTAAAAVGAAVPVPNGSYRTCDAAGTATTMNTVFSVLTAAQANGTWTLTFTDTFPTGDLGNVLGTGCSITITAPNVAPTVTSLNPTSGLTTGGTSVTITGTNFTGATAVTFGAVAATTFTVDTATQITATAPAQAAGTVDVTVTTPGGTSATAGTGDDYTYVTPAPEIDVQDGTATSIASGGTFTVAAPLLGGSTGNTASFSILNTGAANLNITSTTTGTDSNCTSSVTTAPTSPVAAAGNTSFTVTYDVAAGYGNFSFVITIANDDSDEGTYTITVQGTRGLAGTYSINNGGGTPDFTDIGAAFDDLESFGVAGAVILEVYDDGGNYTPTTAYGLGNDTSGTNGATVAGVSSTNTITLRAATGESPVISGSAVNSWNSAVGSISLFDMSFTTIEGLEITGGLNFGLLVDSENAVCDTIQIRRCVIHGITDGAGVFCWNAGGGGLNNFVIENNFVFNCASTSAGVWGPTGTNYLTGIISFRRPGTNFVVQHNSILSNNASFLGGIGSTAGSFDVDTLNFNIIACSSNTRPLMTWPAGDEPVASDYNLFFASSGAIFTAGQANLAAWQVAFTLDANSTEGDPLFINTTVGSEDLHIPFTPTPSPAIDAAVGSTLNIDIDGESRPNGTGRDIGADEALQNAAPTLALASGSSFAAGSDFDLTVNPGAALASASLEASDPTPDPLDITVAFSTGPMGATPPTGITAPASQTGVTTFPAALLWTGSAAASNDAGTYTWTVTLDDGFSTVVYDVNITISNLAPTHAVATGATGTGAIATPYVRQHAVGNAGASNLATVADPNTSQTVSLSGTPTNTATPGTATITWSFALVGGTLQATPSAAPAGVDVGDFDYTVVITDNFSTPATTTFYVRISVIAGTAPAITSTAVTTATVGTLYTYTFTMTGAPAPTISLTTGTLPAWLTLTGNTLSGTPPTGSAGTYGPFTFTATNGVAPDATQSFSIVVSNASSGGGGGGGGDDDSGCSTGENNSLWMLAGVLASFALALRLRRKLA